MAQYFIFRNYTEISNYIRNRTGKLYSENGNRFFLIENKHQQLFPNQIFATYFAVAT